MNQASTGGTHVHIAHSMTADKILEAKALREILEVLGYRVSLHFLKLRQDIETFFLTVLPQAEYAVMCCHGSGTPETGAHLRLEILEQLKGEWEKREFRIRGGDVAGMIPKGSGVLLSTGCHTGRSSVGDAMMKAGFEHYIAPNDWVLAKSGVLFVLNFFYLLKSHEHDDEQYVRMHCIPDAVRMAAETDCADDPHGTSAFVCFPLQVP